MVAENSLPTQSREYAESIINTVREPLIALDHDLRVVSASRSFYEVFKVKPEDTVGQLIYDLGNKQWDIPKLRDLLETILPEKTSFDDYEVDHVFAAIGRRIMLLNARQIERAWGKERIILLAIEDVTERRRLEDLLAESAGNRLTEEKNKAQKYLDVAGVMIIALDPRGRVKLINKKGLAILGYQEDEVIGQNWFDLCVPGTISEKVQEVFSKLMTGGVEPMEYFENPIITKGGEERILAFHNALLRNASGETSGIICSGEDITERKQAEQDLRTAFVKAHESATKWEAIMASMGEGLSIQNTDYIITYQNQVLKESIGDQVGEHCYEAYEHKDQVCEGCPVEMVFSDGHIHNAERTVNIGKKTIYREVIASPLRDIAGNIVAVIEIIRDVTEQKKLAAQLRQSQKMEAIGTLAGGIAHDFNNILNVIMGYGDMVMETLAADSPAREDMHEVLVAADRAADLTKRLLIFSRKKVVEVAPVDINELVLGLQKMLTLIIRENIDFRLDLADQPLLVLADGGQIEQVLMNLAANAKDAMRGGGRLVISTGLEEMDEAYVAAYGYGKPGSYVLITVADTGKGMDAETQKKIFEPFFTTKGVGEGTGLGLAISYGIIKQHNGFIKVYSEPGEGTAFKIYLPLSAEAALAKKTTDEGPVKGGNETILVAEDDAALRKLSRIVLESFGYTVITAEDGDDALAKFLENRERINLVLLDMIMPKKTGKEVAEAVRKVCPGMKILYASGYTMEIITNKELLEEGFSFIQKPYQSQGLLLKVREVLDK